MKLNLGDLKPQKIERGKTCQFLVMSWHCPQHFSTSTIRADQLSLACAHLRHNNSYITITTRSKTIFWLVVCKYSNFKFLWLFLIQTGQLDKIPNKQYREQTSKKLYLCPICLHVPNPHHFDSLFNFLSIVTISYKEWVLFSFLNFI